MGEAFQNPGDEQRELEANSRYEAEKEQYRLSLQPGAAQAASDLVRGYPGVTPDLVAGFATSGGRFLDADIQEIVRRDYRSKGRIQGWANKYLGRVTRPLTAAFQDGWDLGVTRYLRFATNLWQEATDKESQFNMDRAWVQSGSGIYGQSARAMAQGELTPGQLFGVGTPEGRSAMGSGLIYGRPERALEEPGAGRHLEDLFKENQADHLGKSADEMIEENEQWVYDTYGANVVDRAYRSQEATQWHVTAGGTEYSVGVSLGRAAVTPFAQIEVLGHPLLTPDSMPFDWISGTIDFGTQVSKIDPWEGVFRAITGLRGARRALRPEVVSTVDEAYRVSGGTPIRSVELKGPYHGVDVQRPVTDSGVEGYVFSGGDFVEGEARANGFSHGLERAVGYADTVADGPGYVNVYPKDVFPEEIRKVLDEQGEIEQFVRTGQLDEAEQMIVDDIVERHRVLNDEVARTWREAKAVEEEVLASPELAEWNLERQIYESLDPTSRNLEGIPLPKTMGEAFSTYASEVDYARWSAAQDASRQAGSNYQHGSLDLLEGTPRKLKQRLNYDMYGVHPETDPGRLFTSEWGPTPIARIPVEDARKMLEEGWFFENGRTGLDNAKRMVSDDLGAAQVHGKWYPKDPQKALESKGLQGAVTYLTDEGVAVYQKIAWLRGKGIPMHQARRMVDEIAPRKLEDLRADPKLKHLTEDEILEMAGPRDPGEMKVTVDGYFQKWINGQLVTEMPKAPMAYRSLGRTGSKLGAAIGGSAAFLGKSVTMGRAQRAFSDWGRRWAAHSTDSKLDPWDPDTTMDTIVQWYRTLGPRGLGDDVTVDARIDKVLQLAWDSRNDYNGFRKVRRRMLDDLEATWAEQYAKNPETGPDPDELKVVKKVMEDYFDEQEFTTLYNVNAAANPVVHKNSNWATETRADGKKIEVPYNQPILDSELAVQSTHVPSIRQIRRSTSKVRATMDKMRQHPLGLDSSVANKMIDSATATWRDFQLLRPGWMLSVTPDEAMRFLAQGHAGLLRNPMFAFSFLWRRAGDRLPTGASLTEIAEVSGGYGAGVANLGRNVADDTPLRSSQRGGSEAWKAIPTYEINDEGIEVISEAASIAIARNHTQLFQSELATTIGRFEGDVDRAAEWLRNSEEGKQLLNDIYRGSDRKVPDPDGRIGETERPHRWANDAKQKKENDVADAALRQLLEEIDARTHLETGGAYAQRQLDDQGRVVDGWVSSDGEVIEMYTGIDPATATPQSPQGVVWNRDALLARIKEKNPNWQTEYVGLGRRSKADLQALNLELDGYAKGQFDVPDSQQFVITLRGDASQRNILVSGKRTYLGEEMPPATTRRSVIQSWIDEVGGRSGNPRWVIETIGEEGTTHRLVTSHEEVARVLGTEASTETASSVYLIDPDKLDEASQLALMRDDFDGIAWTGEAFGPRWGPESYQRRYAGVVDENAEVMLFNDMGVADVERYQAFVRDEAFANQRAPRRVKAASTVQEERLASTGQRYIDNMFNMFGTRPSNVIRTRYARLVMWENIADYWLYASPQVKAEIVGAASRTGIQPDDLRRFIDKAKLRRGMGADPVLPAKVQLSLEEIEEIASVKAINSTRELFFDLSQRGNWADASKLAFPFADAWWEVMTRWGRLMNPVMAQEAGQPIRNLRRMQQFTTSADRSGWFETDQEGNRVFKWFPGNAMVQGMLGMSEGVGLRNVVGMNQLGFIDFSDDRSLLGPGTGPALQTAASLVRPFIPPKIRDMADWAVWGSWDPKEVDAPGIVDALLPSYLRKAFHRVTGGMEDERFASIQIDLANAAYVADPGKYGDALGTRQGVNQLLEDVHQDAGWLGFVEIIASYFLPVQPRLMVDTVNSTTQGTDQVIDLASASNDYAFLSQYLPEDKVRNTIVDWYDLENPTLLGRKTWRVLGRPTTEAGGKFLEKFAGAEDTLPFTIEGWIPDTLEDTFYGPEYQRQVKEGARQKLTPLQSFAVVSYNAGSQRIQILQEEKNLRLSEAEKLWGTDSPEFRGFRDNVVTPWYNRSRRLLGSSYFGFNEVGAGPVGVANRPGANEFQEEMLRIGTPQTPENEWARKMNPEATTALERIAQEWERYTQASLAEGKSADWWLIGNASTDLTATLLRSRFQNFMFDLTADLSPEAQTVVGYYNDVVITPRFSGVDRGSPFIVHVDPLLSGVGNG